MCGPDIDQNSHKALRAELQAAMASHVERVQALKVLLNDCLNDANEKAPPELIAVCKTIIARYEETMNAETAVFYHFRAELDRLHEALAKDVAALTDQAVALQRSAG